MRIKILNKRRISAVLCAGAIALMPVASFGATGYTSTQETLDKYIEQNCSQSVNYIYSSCHNAIEVFLKYFSIDNSQEVFLADGTKDNGNIGNAENGITVQQQTGSAGGSQQHNGIEGGNQQPDVGGEIQQTAPGGGTEERGLTSQVVDLVNVQRSNSGLTPVTSDAKLAEIAQKKAQDMADNNYFSHTSPTYGSAFDMMTASGYSFSTAGENIAMGQTTSSEVMKGWMNSEGHRKNILKSSFSKIGVGYAENSNGTPYWVQVFAG